MRLQIFNEILAEPPEEPVYLRLVKEREDKVALIACDSSGNKVRFGNILVVSPEGVYLRTGMSQSLGFKQDPYGEIHLID